MFFHVTNGIPWNPINIDSIIWKTLYSSMSSVTYALRKSRFDMQKYIYNSVYFMIFSWCRTIDVIDFFKVIFYRFAVDLSVFFYEVFLFLFWTMLDNPRKFNIIEVTLAIDWSAMKHFVALLFCKPWNETRQNNLYILIQNRRWYEAVSAVKELKLSLNKY